MLTRWASWLKDLSMESGCWRQKASTGDEDWSIEAVIVLDGGPSQWGATSSRFGAVELSPFRGSLVWLLNLHHLWSSTSRVQAGRPSTSQDVPNCGHQFTISMEQSLSWKADSYSASRDIPGILWNQKNHHRIHKSPPPVPVLSQINPSTNSQPISLRYTLIVSSILRLVLPSSLIPSYFSNKTQYAPLLFPIRSTCPAHLITSFDHRTVFDNRVPIMKPLVGLVVNPVSSLMRSVRKGTWKSFWICLLMLAQSVVRLDGLVVRRGLQRRPFAADLCQWTRTAECQRSPKTG